jgi:hypothetical protein
LFLYLDLKQLKNIIFCLCLCLLRSVLRDHNNHHLRDLTQLGYYLKDSEVLRSDDAVENGWILNAGITVAENATLYVNSTDSSWLKIIADEETAYPVHVSGSLKIDSVRISSWNPITGHPGVKSPDKQYHVIYIQKILIHFITYYMYSGYGI